MPESLAPAEAVKANKAIASLYQAEQARGKCYVICFSPRHDLTIAQMTSQELNGVITAWCGHLQEGGLQLIVSIGKICTRRSHKSWIGSDISRSSRTRVS